MNIYFSNDRSAAIFNCERKLQKNYGYLASKIKQRLSELKAANNLAEISHLPPMRRHKLEHNREGQWAVDLNGKYRLIFEPCNDPIPTIIDGGVDLAKVTDILIIEATNYHLS